MTSEVVSCPMSGAIESADDIAFVFDLIRDMGGMIVPSPSRIGTNWYWKIDEETVVAILSPAGAARLSHILGLQTLGLDSL